MYYQHTAGQPLVICDIQHFVDAYLCHHLLATICQTVCPLCSPDEDEIWHGGRFQPSPHCVR